MLWVRCFFARGWAFNGMRSPEFIEAVRTTSLAHLAYTPSEYNILRTRLLDDEVNRVEQQTEKRRRSFTTYGATICSDGWSDVKNHPLINFMAVCPEGEIFEGSVDASENEKIGEWMAMELSSVIDKIGPELVVQVCIDNASNMKSYRCILMEQYLQLYYQDCCTHALDLILEYMGKQE